MLLRRLTGILVAVLVSTAGCSGDDPAPAGGLGRFFESTAYGNPACDGIDQRLAGRREIRLFINGNADLLGATTGLARYYRRHSLAFFTQSEPQPTDLTYAMDTDNTALTTAAQAAFPGVDFNDEAALMNDPVLWGQIQTFVANFVLRPVIDFARAQGTVGIGVTNLVLLPQLVRPGGSGVAPAGATLAGLAISPALLAVFTNGGSKEGDTWKGVDLPADFTPMVFLDGRTLGSLGPRNFELNDLIVAHEFGHTGALVHSTVERNLMFPGVRFGLNDCTDSLDDAQLGTMRTTLGLDGTSGQPLTADGRRDQVTPPPARRFTPADLRALFAGDGQAVRLLLEPFLDGPTGH